jgi:hypothetical protein
MEEPTIPKHSPCPSPSRCPSESEPESEIVSEIVSQSVSIPQVSEPLDFASTTSIGVETKKTSPAKRPRLYPKSHCLRSRQRRIRPLANKGSAMARMRHIMRSRFDGDNAVAPNFNAKDQSDKQPNVKRTLFSDSGSASDNEQSESGGDAILDMPDIKECNSAAVVSASNVSSPNITNVPAPVPARRKWDFKSSDASQKLQCAGNVPIKKKNAWAAWCTAEVADIPDSNASVLDAANEGEWEEFSGSLSSPKQCADHSLPVVDVPQTPIVIVMGAASMFNADSESSGKLAHDSSPDHIITLASVSDVDTSFSLQTATEPQPKLNPPAVHSCSSSISPVADDELDDDAAADWSVHSSLCLDSLFLSLENEVASDCDADNELDNDDDDDDDNGDDDGDNDAQFDLYDMSDTSICLDALFDSVAGTDQNDSTEEADAKLTQDAYTCISIADELLADPASPGSSLCFSTLVSPVKCSNTSESTLLLKTEGDQLQQQLAEIQAQIAAVSQFSSDSSTSIALDNETTSPAKGDHIAHVLSDQQSTAAATVLEKLQRLEQETQKQAAELLHFKSMAQQSKYELDTKTQESQHLQQQLEALRQKLQDANASRNIELDESAQSISTEGLHSLAGLPPIPEKHPKNLASRNSRSKSGRRTVSFATAGPRRSRSRTVEPASPSGSDLIRRRYDHRSNDRFHFRQFQRSSQNQSLNDRRRQAVYGTISRKTRTQRRCPAPAAALSHRASAAQQCATPKPAGFRTPGKQSRAKLEQLAKAIADLDAEMQDDTDFADAISSGADMFLSPQQPSRKQLQDESTEKLRVSKTPGIARKRSTRRALNRQPLNVDHSTSRTGNGSGNKNSVSSSSSSSSAKWKTSHSTNQLHWHAVYEFQHLQ